jgi:hypothetical protein
MGLSISVGLLADLYHNDTEGFEYHREAFERLSGVLAGEGIDWREPDAVELPDAHEYSAGFPYGYLTRLRRIYVLAKGGESITPAAEINTPQYEHDLRLIDDETAMLASHLLCHADDSGYYLPIDFPDPLFLPQELELEGGGMVGSCYRLLEELAEIESVLAACSPKGSFEPERYAWSRLREACEASIAGGHAIVFC